MNKAEQNNLKMLDRAYGAGQMSMFEWFDFKDRYSLPEKETNQYYRTCLFPVLGKRSYHLGKLELWYAFKCMTQGWKMALQSMRVSVEKREQDERMQKTKDRMIERFMAW